MRKVSKQVALGFIERTLLRCRSFELTGRSCFSEPCLQNVLFAAPEVNDTGTGNMPDSRIGHGASKNRMETTKAGILLYFKENCQLPQFAFVLLKNNCNTCLFFLLFFL